MLLCVVWTVLMILWLFGGGWSYWDPAKPQTAGALFIAWLCVAILGYIIFSGHSVVQRGEVVPHVVFHDLAA